MITIDALTKKYGRTTVVDGVSFVAHPGRVTGFLGPNGAGKSTTMRMVVGLTKPTSGSSTVAGRAFADLPNPGREIGVMLDASAQHAGRTGREILTIVQQTLGLRQQPGRRDARPRQPHRGRGRPSRRQLLARHAAAAGDRLRPDRQPGCPHARRTRQRARPRRHPLDARPAPRLRRPGRDGAPLLAPAARGRDHRRRHRDDRPRADRVRGLHGRPRAIHGHRSSGPTTSPRCGGRCTRSASRPRSPTRAAWPPRREPSRVGQAAFAAGIALTELRTADGGLEDMFLELTTDTQRERKVA